jgi:hypothetical protein
MHAGPLGIYMGAKARIITAWIEVIAMSRAITFIRPFFLVLLVGPLMGQSGSTVASQTALNAILGSSAFTETFQGYTLASGTAVTATGVTSLDSTSIVNAQGPGLVGRGITYSGPTGGQLQWDAPGYFNAASEELLIDLMPTITLTFTAPTDAFGVNVRDFQGYTNSMTVTIYGADHTTVLNTFSGITITDPAIFFGYQYSGGIGTVVLTDSGSWSPILSNLTFAPVPEPPTVALIAGGLSVVFWFLLRKRHLVPGRKM